MSLLDKIGIYNSETLMTKEQKSLIIECLTGTGGFEVAMEYLLKMKVVKKRSPYIEKKLREFLKEIREQCEEMTYD